MAAPGTGIYTVVSFSEASFEAVWKGYRAGTGMDAVMADQKLAAADARFVACLQGNFRRACGPLEQIEPEMARAAAGGFRGSTSRREAVVWTAVGYWLASGETIVQQVVAGAAPEAMQLVRRRLVEEARCAPSDARLVGCCVGAALAAVTAENLPLGWTFRR
ncbi:MAG: hypothetical protein KAY22_08010 [Rhizorhabdus sp.]|uniref:hypothetical protein n=1 Tax=Rhizorhabdus sp. TaxID=1968843 RepID=UPI001B52CF88|nr:hypothetical protein [Rhizorhabdus sp.]MBP8232232.1 hypothetical protein [Rhizorhabdus sp.]